MLLLQIIFWLVLVFAAIQGFALLFRRLLTVEHQRDEIHYVDTDDGWRLALIRHRPAQRRGATPILLVPPLGFSAAIYEIGEHAWARSLSEAGFDVWIVDLRGRGDATTPRLGGRHRRSWCVDDYIELDLPAAIRGVCAATGVESIDLLAFGVGALVAYPVVAGPAGAQVRSLVSLAGAAHFSRQQERFSPRWLGPLRWLRPRLLLALLGPLVGRLELPLLRHFGLLENLEGATYRRALVNAAADLAPREIQQWRSWFELDRYRAGDDGPDYRESLERLAVPMLCVCGPRDGFAPPSMVRETLDACVRAPTRALLIASRHEGLTANYGHLDLLLGRSVARDVQPRVIEWLVALDRSSEQVETSADESGAEADQEAEREAEPATIGEPKGVSEVGAS